MRLNVWNLPIIFTTASGFIYLYNSKRLSVVEAGSIEVNDTLNWSFKKWRHDWDVDCVNQSLTGPSETPSDHHCTQPRSYCKRILFIRHGQYNIKADNREHRALTYKGWMQAYHTGLRLKHLGIRIDHLIHSDMIRARQTTLGLLSGLYFNHDLVLHAYQLSELINRLDDGATVDCLASLPPPACQDSLPYQPFAGCAFACQQSAAMAEGPPPVQPEPNLSKASLTLEQRRQEGRRIDNAFQEFIHRVPVIHHDLPVRPSTSSPDSYPTTYNGLPMETIVFVGHANVFRYWLLKALQLPVNGWLRLSLPHGSITQVDIIVNHQSGDKPTTKCTVKLRRMGDAGHLPPWLLTH